jgi:osmotically-inducible protein OsmY
MAYEEQQTKQSRVVVETPTARREVTRTDREYTPSSGGTSTATIAVVVILAVGVVVLLALLVMNRQNNDANLAAQQASQQPAQQAPIILQQPAPQQQPIILQQPAAPAAQPPIIVNQPASGGSTAPAVPDDSSIQSEIDKRLQKDFTPAALNITVSVLNGKAMLMGTVKSDQLKSQIEKVVLAVKGVNSVDNQLIVSAG